MNRASTNPKHCRTKTMIRFKEGDDKVIKVSIFQKDTTTLHLQAPNQNCKEKINLLLHSETQRPSFNCQLATQAGHRGGWVTGAAFLITCSDGHPGKPLTEKQKTLCSTSQGTFARTDRVLGTALLHKVHKIGDYANDVLTLNELH